MINIEQLISSNSYNISNRLYPNIHKSIVKDTEYWVLKLETILRFKYKRTYYLMKCINTNIIDSPTDHQHIVIALEKFIKLSHTDKDTELMNINRVDLPFDHLNEDKINKYLDVLSKSLLEDIEREYKKSKL